MPSRLLSVYLHIGPPKTGTTYLQDVLWRNRNLLARRGLTFPGSRPADHFHAALDLRGIDFAGHVDPVVRGGWARLADKALGAPTDKAVISHELFAGADLDQIAVAVKALSPADVHVVFGARDLARQLPAVWQESLKNRRTRTFDRFLSMTLDPGTSPDSGFWRSHDPVAVLRRWREYVPPERIHVVTLPQADEPESALWERFCQALGIAPGGVDSHVARRNASLSLAQAEVLRRLNLALPGDLEWPTYERVVKRRFNEIAGAGGGGRRPRVPRRHREAVVARSELAVSGLTAAGYDVIGDLADLVPAAASFGGTSTVPAGKITDAAVGLLADTLVVAEPSETPAERARSLFGQLRRGQGSA